MTKEQAMEIIRTYKDNTCYFDNSLSISEMEDMFRYRFGFGIAESKVIVAALVNSGAKFKDIERDIKTGQFNPEIEKEIDDD